MPAEPNNFRYEMLKRGKTNEKVVGRFEDKTTKSQRHQGSQSILCDVFVTSSLSGFNLLEMKMTHHQLKSPAILSGRAFHMKTSFRLLFSFFLAVYPLSFFSIALPSGLTLIPVSVFLMRL
jgi:hypothetical protein